MAGQETMCICTHRYTHTMHIYGHMDLVTPGLPKIDGTRPYPYQPMPKAYLSHLVLASVVAFI